MRWGTALIALCALSLWSAPSWAASPLYLVSIGSNETPEDTSESLGELRFADDDAARFFRALGPLARKRALLTVADLDTQRAHPELATHARAPSLAELDDVLSGFAASMRGDLERGDSPVLIVTYSGHGTRTTQGTPYLHLSGSDRLTRELLAERILDATPARRVHLIVDSCHAGDVVGARGGFFDEEASADPAETPSLVAAGDLQERYPHLGILLASTQGASLEWSSIRSGIFSHEVLSALLGAADVNGDGAVAYSEVAAFVSSANLDVPDREVAPKVVARPPALDLAQTIVTVPGSRPALVSGAFSGRLSVESERGVRYVDANLSDTSLRVLLPPEDVLLVRTARGVARVELAGDDVDLDRLAFEGESALARGDLGWGRGFFGALFGRGYYEGFVADRDLVPVRFDAAPVVVGAPEPVAEPCCGWVPVGFAIASGLSLAVAVGAGVDMGLAAHDYNSTQFQVPAREARERYFANRDAVVVALGVAAATGALAWWLWPVDERAPSVGLGVSPGGLTIGGVW